MAYGIFTYGSLLASSNGISTIMLSDAQAMKHPGGWWFATIKTYGLK